MHVYTNYYIISVYLYVVEANTCSILVLYLRCAFETGARGILHRQICKLVKRRS